MGLFDFLFMREKSWTERAVDIVTKGDFSSKAVDGRKVAAIATGAAAAAAKANSNVSHAQSYQQDQAARAKNGK
jgi:hypothetical protein